MDARTRDEAITTRLGALALPLGVILFVVVTAIFHPHREAPMENPAVFMEYAESDSWVVIHFAQWFAALLLIGGFVALYYSITSKPEANAVVLRFGLVAALLTGAALTMLQAVDGVALKWAVDAWASAPADQEVAAFSAAQALRWTEYSLQSYSFILLGVTFILYGVAIALGTVYPRWLGWLAMGSGVAWIVHGLVVPYVGLFNSIPRLVAIVLMALWAFIIGVLMWRTARSESAPLESATTPASPR